MKIDHYKKKGQEMGTSDLPIFLLYFSFQAFKQF